ncbi:DNA-binding transcriptional activator BglJ [Serratia fonticola]|uniref:DNA-binding transcriptional activator BglJ n=1 Tax=Serratia fonticola TaxID=47917 RepID=A0A0F7HD87_SERFO|nr:LuxR family transcriptional regulator [Serratia fonticola]AKG70927.1 hypothetical protein WN53_18360 [Serratia fonticola]CAI1684513.1 DNA-binding transcriptional activator BglJ [Serratia fonticola]VTR36682.1 DNA-binding transcriptional activator BglJ [Serratia fonticola]
MKNIIHITILDNDQYFSNGLMRAIHNSPQMNTDINLAVDCITPYKKKSIINYKSRVDMDIYESKYETSRVFFPCGQDGLCIFKDASLERNTDSIKRAIQLLKDKSSEKSKYCEKCPAPQLSHMEHHVLQLLSWGLSPTSIAHINNLSFKTISRHKRNAMEKLSIHNNTELNYFILKTKEFIKRKATVTLFLQK